MTIWRGEGGGGDATTDSEINLITALANSVAADKVTTTAAADSATASALAASTSEINAAASYDSFDDRYLGSKVVDPTLDNDGNALLVGALYWNTSSNRMLVWSGSVWNNTFFSGLTNSLVTATAGQLIVTVPSYTTNTNTIQVYVNGLKVISGVDYSESSTTTITFTSGLTLGDEVEVLVVQSLDIGTTSASNVSYVPTGTIAASNVQAAINEVNTEAVHITGTETITGAKTFSNTITGAITGNAGTVTNGVYTSGDQTIAGNKTFSSSIIGSITGNAATATNATTAASCSGNAATVTNGVYTTGDQTIGGNKTFSNTILGSISGANGVFTGDVQATSYNGGQLAGLRNKIINGNMGIAQRGTAAVTTSGGYGPADRWTITVVGDTFSATQGSFVSGDTIYDTGGAQYFTSVAVTSVAAATNACIFRQLIEDVRLLAGQTVTVSFWAKAASGTPSIGVSVDQFFGSGGSPSVQANGTGQAQALTTTWTKYSKTFAVPSINGKTIGTTINTSYTIANFWLDAGSDFNTRSGSIGQASKTVSIAQVQLEIGSVSTPFEFRPVQIETALCQRYARPVSNNTCMGQAFGTTGATLNCPGVPMRAGPTLSTTTGFTLVSASGTSLSITGLTVPGIAQDGTVVFSATVASGLVGGNATYINQVGSGAILSAEL